LLHTKHLCEERVFLGLGVDTVVCSAKKHSSVSLGCTGDHVLDEITVTWSIDDGPVVVRGEEFLVSDVDGDTTFSLFLESVHNVSKTESSLTGFSSELFVLFDDVTFNVSGVQK